MEQVQKKHLIITGSRGIGKTTLFQTICPPKGPGIRTYAKRTTGPKPDAIILEDMATSATAVLGLPGPSRMDLIPSVLEDIAIPILSQNFPRFYIDEIGYVESNHKAYWNTLQHILETASLIAVLRKEDTLLSRQILCRDDVCVLDLDTATS